MAWRTIKQATTAECGKCCGKRRCGTIGPCGKSSHASVASSDFLEEVVFKPSPERDDARLSQTKGRRKRSIPMLNLEIKPAKTSQHFWCIPGTVLVLGIL